MNRFKKIYILLGVLAVSYTHLDVYKRQEHKQRFLTSIATMSQQMRGLIEQLLELTKLDNTDTPHDTQTVDFSRLISDALLPFEPVFFEKGLTLQAKIEENVLVTGQERQLCQVLEILLDNAQKYSYASSTCLLYTSRCV